MKANSTAALRPSGLETLVDETAPGEHQLHGSVWLRRLAEFCTDAILLGAVVMAFPVSIILLGLPVALLVRGILWALGRSWSPW